ncbi:peroxiredoxin [Thiomicrospira microaerophila]|uniref:peroxiredoxin n=1 Tax=Thiomicrospira microaerophila TaxID=406020 RepID=UPI000AAE6AA1|nr:peroxiredoxin [Thiomicrospira microaerophila]
MDAFSLSATPEQTLTLSNLSHQYSVLYFYPKDNTPGCSQEGQDFSDLHNQFKALGAQVYGVSMDSLTKHQHFKQKYNFPFELISDPDQVLCNMFDVIKLKKNFGKEYYGIERSTFILSPDNQVIASWRKVKVNGHAQAVLESLIAYQNTH